MMQNPSFTSFSSAFGRGSIVWDETQTGPKVQRVFLPRVDIPAEHLVRLTFVDASPLSHPIITELGERIQRFLDGEAVHFELNIVDLGKCAPFQKRVLLAEYEIPRSWVSSYGRIAKSLETPGGARAIGNALSRNPFPIIIPCHRAIGSHGKLGGFQGGFEMKKALLELEGIEFSEAGMVITDRIYY